MATSFSTVHFGKPIDQITEDDLNDYFLVERAESLTLEFKSYSKKGSFSYEGMLRGVAAFLNSEGGLLIFGAPDEIGVREKYKVVKGPLTPIETAVTTKDSIVRTISDNISYMPVGYRVEAIPVGDKFVYLIEVQESNNKPHQFKKQYPVRLDGQSIGAPHYLVEALFKQVKAPELTGLVRIASYEFLIPKAHNTSNKIKLLFKAHIFNQSKAINDSGVYFYLTVSDGNFVAFPSEHTQYRDQGKSVFVKNDSSLLTYAMASECHFVYEINSQEYSLFTGHDIKLEFTFGSNKSETRRSVYYFKFKDIRNMHINDRQYTLTKDLNTLIELSREENISVNDLLSGEDSIDKRQVKLDGI